MIVINVKTHHFSVNPVTWLSLGDLRSSDRISGKISMSSSKRLKFLSVGAGQVTSAAKGITFQQRFEVAMDNWGKRLSEAMENKGIHKALTLAIDLGVSEGTISRWKKSGPITIKHAVALCETLDVSLNWLLLGTRAETTPTQENHANFKHQIGLNEGNLPPSLVKAISNLIDEISKHQSGLA